MATSRSPAVAGMFYPADPRELARLVADLLTAAPNTFRADDTTRGPSTPVKALIVPHAGYIYSGAVAALGYAALTARPRPPSTVVLLGPAHRAAVSGLALTTDDAFESPLGTVPVQPPAADILAALPQLVSDVDAHRGEHSIEVQLPFLQTVLPGFTLVPLAVGRVAPQQVAEVLTALWGGPETLLVISSDLSHYLPHELAVEADQATLARVLALDATVSHEQACGATPVNGLLLAAAAHGLTPRLLGSATSGDTAGDRRRVVGYAAVAFTEEAGHADT